MDALSRQAPARLGAWMQALRPKTLALSLAPVLVGSSWAASVDGVFAPSGLVLAALGAAAIQIGTNLWNDALDGERGVDAADRLGPIRATAAGLIAADRIRHAALAAFGIAVAAGLGLVVLGGPLILAIGVAGIACGLFYSAGPAPIAATPFGELVVLAFFGVAGVVGTALVHGGTPSWPLAALGLFSGLPAAAVLLVNNHRDRVNDARAGRHTLAIVLGPERTPVLYAALLAGAAVTPLVAVGVDAWGLLLSLVLGLQSRLLARRLARAPIGRQLNGLLAQTARFQLLVAALTAVGLLVVD